MKAIIVEDEFPAREELKYFIKNFSKIFNLFCKKIRLRENKKKYIIM